MVLPFLFPSYKNPCDFTGPTWIIQPWTGSMIFLPWSSYHVQEAIHRLRGLGGGHFRGHYPASHNRFHFRQEVVLSRGHQRPPSPQHNSPVPFWGKKINVEEAAEIWDGMGSPRWWSLLKCSASVASWGFCYVWPSTSGLRRFKDSNSKYMSPWSLSTWLQIW